MTCRSLRFSVIAAAAVTAGLVLTPLAEAQETRPNEATSVPTPRTPDGKPDLSGFWAGGGGEGAHEPTNRGTSPC